MSDTDKLIQRLDQLLDRLEPYLPALHDNVAEFDGGAYRWQTIGNSHRIEKITQTSEIHLNDLQCIDRQKHEIDDNTRQFLRELPANNVLLWGPKGTGKSSLIKALLNQYRTQGLNLIEVQRQDLIHLSEIVQQLRDKPGKFILFCDDLSFEANDPSYKAIKVALDGSLSATPDNVLIYATSNRRHLLPETMRDNVDSGSINGELHLDEAIEEKISLSERFGIWLSFHPFSQDDYLTIVDYWLQQYSAEIDDQKQLHKMACKWALEHGSRSGRSANQFVRYWVGKQKLSELEND